MLKDVRAILFDAVGTLIYPDPPVRQVYFETGRAFGTKLLEQEIASGFSAAFTQREGQYTKTNQSLERQRWREIVSDVFHDIKDADEQLFAALWDHFAQSENWGLYDDVEQAWKSVLQSGLIIGVASNFDDRLLNIFHDLSPLDSCEHLFWSAQLGHSKPSPKFFRAVEQQLGLRPHEILLVGDHPNNDREGAQAAGWNSLLLDRFSEYDGNDRIQSLSEIA